MEKSPDAFRTISEVAEWLDVPTHVLRFWESRFAQVKPVKRAGGRRYYRPADMRLIGGIKALLHDDGMTIRGVQKLLREEGVKHVASFSQPLDHERSGAIDHALAREKVVAEHADSDLPFLPPGPTVHGVDTHIEVLRAEEPMREEPADVTPAPEASEEVADAEWSRGTAGVPEADEDAAWNERDTAASDSPAEAEVVSFGSVRGPRHEPADTAPRQPEFEGLDAPDRTEEFASAPPAPDVSEPSELPTSSEPEPEPTPEPEPEPEPAPRPILCDAPETDPDDDAPEHALPPGAVARLLVLDRSMLARDPIRIEQVVAALRTVRDRSAP